MLVRRIDNDVFNVSIVGKEAGMFSTGSIGALNDCTHLKSKFAGPIRRNVLTHSIRNREDAAGTIYLRRPLRLM